jgi:peptidoglycan lytic transglycosylase
MKLTPLSFEAQTVVNSSFVSPVPCKTFANQSDYRKEWLSGRKLYRGFSSGFTIFASLTVAMSLGGTLNTALAADGPKAGIARSSQEDPFEVPGSFKDLPDARDAVTAKRLPEQIKLPASTGTMSTQLAIDVEKVAATAGLSFGEKVNTIAGDTFYDGDLVDFHATAYCLKGRTASGVNTRPGMIAADPRVLPLGTVVHLRAGRYTGTYTVTDTGGLIKGRIVDVYVPTYREAIQFGRQRVKIKVIGRASAKSRRDGKNLMASER